jgi:hypothetical protein
MKDRDDLGASHIPAIDWLELSLWTLLTAFLCALAAAFIHGAFVPGVEMRHECEFGRTAP